MTRLDVIPLLCVVASLSCFAAAGIETTWLALDAAGVFFICIVQWVRGA